MMKRGIKREHNPQGFENGRWILLQLTIEANLTATASISKSKEVDGCSNHKPGFQKTTRVIEKR